MGKYAINDTTLVSIADAIREKIGFKDSMTGSEMAGHIKNISGGGTSKAFTITPSADNRKLSVTGLSKKDYGYLLDCDTLMIHSETDTTTTRYYICSALCYIGEGITNKATTPNRAIACNSSKISETYNLFESVTVTEESGGISVTIQAEIDGTRYFAGDVAYSIVGLKI